MNCKVCQKVFSGIENFKQHEVSEKHKRKLLLHNILMSSQSVNACASTPNIQNVNPNAYPCKTCALTFQTLSEFTEHSDSEEHALMILQRRNTQVNPPQLNINSCTNSTLQAMSEMDLNSFRPRTSWQSRCEKCDKNFSGPEPYQQHIDSFDHKNKCGLLPPSETPVELPTSLSCKLCDATFSGPASYHDHMRGTRHKKKVMALSNRTNEKTFTVPHQQPYMSEAQQKEKIIPGKENSCVSSGSDVVELPEKQNDFVPRAWYCEACDIQCSGIDPFRQHLVSIKHVKKAMRGEAGSKVNELQSLLSGQISTVGNFGQTSRQVTEIDGIKRSDNATTGDLGKEVRNFLYGDGWDTKICTPSDLNLTFFAVGEKINFDKNTKIKVEVKDLDMVDVKEEDEEMDE